MTSLALQKRRKFRVRKNLAKHNKQGRPRLTVFRSNQHIYAQVIDDVTGKTLVSASTFEKELAKKVANGSNIDAAKQVGAAIAKKAKDAKITEVIFDRGGYIYHGRVKALADEARANGLTF